MHCFFCEDFWHTPLYSLVAQRSLLHSCERERRCWLFILHNQGSADEAFTLQSLTNRRQKPSVALLSPSSSCACILYQYKCKCTHTHSNTPVSSQIEISEWFYFLFWKNKEKKGTSSALKKKNRKYLYRFLLTTKVLQNYCKKNLSKTKCSESLFSFFLFSYL